MDDADEEDESDDAIPEEAVIDKFLDMSTYIEPRSGKQAEIIQFMKVMLVQGYEIQSNMAMLRVQVKKMQADVDALKGRANSRGTAWCRGTCNFKGFHE